MVLFILYFSYEFHCKWGGWFRITRTIALQFSNQDKISIVSPEEASYYSGHLYIDSNEINIHSVILWLQHVATQSLNISVFMVVTPH